MARKEYCKVINLRSGKDVYIPISVPKRRIEPVLTQKEIQAEEEPTGVNSQATTLKENNNPSPIGENNPEHIKREAVCTACYNRTIYAPTTLLTKIS